MAIRPVPTVPTLHIKRNKKLVAAPEFPAAAVLSNVLLVMSDVWEFDGFDRFDGFDVFDVVRIK
jgi:hypothetical protein